LHHLLSLTFFEFSSSLLLDTVVRCTIFRCIIPSKCNKLEQNPFSAVPLWGKSVF